MHAKRKGTIKQKRRLTNGWPKRLDRERRRKKTNEEEGGEEKRRFPEKKGHAHPL